MFRMSKLDFYTLRHRVLSYLGPSELGRFLALHEEALALRREEGDGLRKSKYTTKQQIESKKSSNDITMHWRVVNDTIHR